MRSRATIILAAAALVQAALLLMALAVLVLQLREVRSELTRQESGERSFLNQLAEAERNMYRTSILLRDYVLVSRDEQPGIRLELADVLSTLAEHPIAAPPGLPADVSRAVSAAQAAREEFLKRAHELAALDEVGRRSLGPRYLPRQLSPLREEFVEAAREMDGLVLSLRESRNRAMAGSLARIQTWILKVLLGAVVLGLILAGAGIWRFRHYEREREMHLAHLEQAEDGLRALSQTLVESQETERKQISRELHDEVGQNLTALRVQLGQIVAARETGSEANLALASELADRCLRTVRDMARGLRPAMLDDLGLGPALQWLGRDFSRNTSLDVDVTVEGDLSGLDEAQRTCLYRVAQESLNNCAKHSGASAAAVAVSEDADSVALTVSDSGRGISLADGSAGIGLLGMRERVEELEGEFDVTSPPQGGTMIRAVLPKTRRGKHASNSARG